jgi:PAS domain-containing protein
MLGLQRAIRPWTLLLLVLAAAGFVWSLFGVLGSTAQNALALALYVVVSVALIGLIERERRTAVAALRRERAARESETAAAARGGRLETALESVDAGVHSFDPATGQAQWDARFRNLLGVTADQPATREALLSRVHPDDRPRVEAAVMNAMAAGAARR